MLHGLLSAFLTDNIMKLGILHDVLEASLIRLYSILPLPSVAVAVGHCLGQYFVPLHRENFKWRIKTEPLEEKDKDV